MSARGYNQLKQHPGKEQLSLFPESKKENTSLDALYQYFLVIAPPDDIKNKVRGLKHKLHDVSELSDYNLFSVPHISLINFHTIRPVNERFIEAVQNVFLRNRTFEVELSGYDFFLHGNTSYTIYVKIKDTDPITNLHNELSMLLGLPIHSFTPHLAVARTISRLSFEKGYSTVAKNTIDEKFICNNVTILERKIQNGVVSDYKVLKEVKL